MAHGAHHGPPSWVSKLPFPWDGQEYEHINGAILVFLAILVGSILVNRVIKGKTEENLIPKTKFSLFTLFDLVVEGLHGLVVGILGHHGEEHFPFIAALFVFVWLGNLIGLLPMSASPNSQLATTMALGIASFVYYNYKGIKSHGLVGYGQHFLMGLGIFGIPIAFFELISHVIRPLTLGLRLAVNMHIDHMLAGAFTELCKWIVPVPLLLFGVVVCTIQAFLFAVLTTVYVQMATEHEDH